MLIPFAHPLGVWDERKETIWTLNNFILRHKQNKENDKEIKQHSKNFEIQ